MYMPTNEELQPFLGNPREDLAVEYKNWLDLRETAHKATIAKAAMAMANHGGGFIVIGFDDQGHELVPVAKPAAIPELTQDAVNASVNAS
jgi:predicted HTH transcriptional regulator